MPHSRISVIGLILVVLALGSVAPTARNAEASGGPLVPIFDDEVVSIATDGTNVFVAPAWMHDLMVQHYGGATLDTLGSAIACAPPASTGSAFVMHDCEAAGDAVNALASSGYVSVSVDASRVPGFGDDVSYSD